LPFMVLGGVGPQPQYLAAYKASVELLAIGGLPADNYDHQGHVVTFVGDVDAARFTLVVENQQVICRLERRPLTPKTVCEVSRGKKV
jgi:hypothetical protein